MKARQLLPLPLVMTLLFTLGGCREAIKKAMTLKGIKSADDLVRAGKPVPVKEILQAAQRKWSLRNKISGELYRIASNIDPSQPLAFGAAVVEAHCSGLKRELATGEPFTARDYAIYLAIELAENQIPTPPDKQIGEAAKNLVEVARGLYALTRDDEAARRAYIKEMCKIP